jgi:CubicO group peptidase (beta-lactamase class C family)
MNRERFLGELDSSIPIIMGEHDIPGLSVAIISNDVILWSKGFGHTDITHRQPVTNKTLFSIQSISKTYTAFGFMLAVDAGIVSLDEPITRHLPRLRLNSRDGIDHTSEITFRHLLTHRSGLPHEAPIGNNFSYAAFEEHILSINDVWLKCRPGERYSYSNLGYDLLGYVLQLLSDKPFEQYMKDSVFTPLGMQNSTFTQSDFLSDITTAIGHAKAPLVKYPIPMVPAGGMYSCPVDMARFVTYLLSTGKSATQRLMRVETLRQMYAVDAVPDIDSVYCLGITVGQFNGTQLLNHNGGGFGFMATQDILVDQGLGVVVLTNSVNHPSIQVHLSRRILADLLDLSRTGRDDCKPAADPSWKEFTGLYGVNYNLGTEKKSVTLRDGVLYVGTDKLTQHSTNLFATDDGENVEFTGDSVIYGNITYKRMEPYLLTNFA